MINKDQYLKDALDAEISILKQLNHPNIVRFMEKLSSDRSIYIVTEFCQDGDLRSVMKSANISEVKVFEIFCQLIEGFKVLQQKNIIHRDLKPANILNHNGIVKIADFGFAKFVNDFNNQLLRTCVGSPLYMSPQILQRQKYTTKSDIWSLGVIYYEMLFKTTPWNGYDENSLKENVLSQPLKIPDSGRLSKESTTFLIGALQKEEANRIEWSEVFSLFSNIKSNKKIPNISYFRKEKQEPTNIQIIQIQHQDSLSVQNTLKSKNIIRQQLSFTYFVNVEMIQNIIQINNSYQKELHFEMLCLLQARQVSLKYEYYLKEITQILQEQNKTQIFASYLNVIQKEFDLANELLNDTIQYFERTGLLIQLKQQSVEYSFIEKRLDDSKIVELENLVKTKILTLAKGILKQDANSITISYEVLSLLDYILDAMNISNSIKNNSIIDFEQIHDKHKYRNDLTKFADDIRKQCIQLLKPMINELFQIQIGESLSCIDLSKDFIAVGTLDENVYLTKKPYSVDQKFQKLPHHLMGVIDIAINKDETQLAVSSLDSCIRIWDIDDKKLISQIQCEAYANWKVRFLDSQTIVTAGEQGLVHFYHIDTKERTQKIETDNIYYASSLQINNDLIAVGNEGGSLFLCRDGVKKQLKPHSKPIRSLCFLDSNQLLTGSEDGLIKLIDLEKLEVTSIFRNHKYGVNSIAQINEQEFISCSTDRSIRVWDKSQIYSTRSYQLLNDKPGAVSGVAYQKNQILAAHDCGMICFYVI